jgi:hypothetical protein
MQVARLVSPKWTLITPQPSPRGFRKSWEPIGGFDGARDADWFDKASAPSDLAG